MQEVCLSGIWKWLQMWVLLNLNLPVSLWRNVGKGVGTDAAEWLHGVNVKLSISWVQEIKHNSWWCKREVWALVSVTPKNLLQCLRITESMTAISNVPYTFTIQHILIYIALFTTAVAVTKRLHLASTIKGYTAPKMDQEQVDEILLFTGLIIPKLF